MPSIVLALGDLRLVYLRIVDAADGSIEFHYIQHPLLASDDPLHEPGYSLATESSARALAIAGSDGPIAVVALAVQSSDAAETTESELSVPVAASVIKIAFLLPPSGEGITALIAVVVGAKDGRLGIFSCVWDTDVPSNLENSKRSAHRLGNEHGLPSLVIPLKAPLHFMLVCDRLMAIYQLSTDGSLVQVHAVPLFDDSSAALDKSEDVSDTVVKPRWVSWARPVRRKDWAHEALYLASEDGHLKYVVIKASGAGLRIAEHSDAGKLDMNVGSAFAILDIPQADLEHGALPDDEDMGKYTTGYSDVFIAAGVHSDGGLYEVCIHQ